MGTWSSVVVTLIGALLLASPVLAQSRGTIRVIAERAEVRLRADPNSVVMTSVAAGSVLTLVGQEGPWFAVVIPGAPGSEPERIGYLSSSQAEPFGPAPTTTVTDSAVQVTRAQSSAAQDAWQLRFDRAQRNRSAGKKKFWLGTSILVGGAILSQTAAFSCDAYSCDYSDTALIGAYVALGGGVLELWGIIQWMGANGDLSNLEAQRPMAWHKRQAPTPQLSHSFSW